LQFRHGARQNLHDCTKLTCSFGLFDVLLRGWGNISIRGKSKLCPEWRVEGVALKVSTFVGCVAAIACASATPAFARDQRPVAPAATPQTAQAPWYERFTFGSELREGANAWVPRGESTAAIVDSRSRWGVTFGVSQEPRGALAPRAGQPATRASAGAFYQVSPKVRVGGAVTLPEDQLGVSAQRRNPNRTREPGVKIESAVRF
jgi:hypothetical protein